MKYITLAQLSTGSSAYIYTINANSTAIRRLLDFGFSAGSKIDSLFKSPLGGLKAYGVMGSVVALRNELAEQIIVLPIEEVIP